MILGGNDAHDATPLSDEDLDGLIPTWVISRADLNLAEQANIERAFGWAYEPRRIRRLTAERLLTREFSDELHRRMFASVWAWAGKPRNRETNIGVDPALIPVKLRDAFDDARFWHHNSSMTAEEIAVRIHHRLVAIHPYRNGNGRHTRLIGDLYLTMTEGRNLTWGGTSLVDETLERRRYIDALRKADNGDYAMLFEFATAK